MDWDPEVRAKLNRFLQAQEVASAQLKGDQKIPSAQQKVIAIYLRRDPRDIYTDIPPP